MCVCACLIYIINIHLVLDLTCILGNSIIFYTYTHTYIYVYLTLTKPTTISFSEALLIFSVCSRSKEEIVVLDVYSLSNKTHFAYIKIQ